MATTKAHMKATAKYEKNNYFKTLVRFKKEDEERIRAAAGDSLNGFIVNCVLDVINKAEERQTSTQARNARRTVQTCKSGLFTDYIGKYRKSRFRRIVDRRHKVSNRYF